LANHPKSVVFGEFDLVVYLRRAISLRLAKFIFKSCHLGMDNADFVCYNRGMPIYRRYGYGLRGRELGGSR
jgi:hypothetical protein